MALRRVSGEREQKVAKEQKAAKVPDRAIPSAIRYFFPCPKSFKMLLNCVPIMRPCQLRILQSTLAPFRGV